MKRAAKALIRDDQGRILVLYRSETHPYLAHDIDLPGGEIEHREKVEQGLMREIVEETGVEVELGGEHRRHMWRPGIARTRFLYEIDSDGAPSVSISWEHKSYVWMSEEEFVEHPAVDGFIHRVQAWLRSSGA